jgi:hypothetical protein
MKKRKTKVIFAVLIFVVVIIGVVILAMSEYVGNVTVVSNQTTYKPFSNRNHGESPKYSVSGIPVFPEHVLGLETPWSEENVRGEILPNVIYTDDFRVNIRSASLNPLFTKSGSFILYTTEYTIEESDVFDSGEEYVFETAIEYTDINNLEKLYSYLRNADTGEYLLQIHIWWRNGRGYGSSIQYFFKIIVE